MTLSRSTILVSTARSGTNFFLENYRLHFPQDIVLGEIFRRRSDSLEYMSKLLKINAEDLQEKAHNSPRQLWEELKTVAAQEEQGIIAKIFYYHAADHTELWDGFKRDEKIIHLIRRNAFDSFVSLQLAQRSEAWKSTSPNQALVDGISLEINPTAAEKYIEEVCDGIRGVRQRFKDADYHEIYYEDIISESDNGHDVFAELYGTDGTENKNKTGLNKQNTVSHSDRISNYDSLKHLDRNILLELD